MDENHPKPSTGSGQVSAASCLGGFQPEMWKIRNFMKIIFIVGKENSELGEFGKARTDNEM